MRGTEIIDMFNNNLKTERGSIKPFLKWAGGKYRIVSTLKKYFPQKAERFIEPFVGAGGVCLNVDYSNFIINDFNSDLINVYKFLQKNKKQFIQDCKKMFIEDNNINSKYYELRTEFNSTSEIYRKAIIFIYLNRHCFNGLCRYNTKGGFNTPFGKYHKPYFPEKEMTKAINKIEKFKIINVDFREVFKEAQDKDVIYCDPPYVPMSESASFNSYSVGGFQLQDQIDLAKCAFEASQKGATVIVSNHYNWYTKQIYNQMFGARLITTNVKRTISSKVEERKPVKEVIAIFKKD